MLFRKRLVNEMVWVAMALLVVLLLILLTTQIVRLLGEAALGALASSAVWVVLGFATVRYMPVLFSLMLFVSVLVVMTRLWKDHEIMVWFAAGRSLRDFVRPVMSFVLPVVLLIGALSLFVSPWASHQSKLYREAALAQQDMTQLSPGVFRDAGGAGRVYFVENFSGAAQAGNNVFVQLRDDQGKYTWLLAERGGLQVDERGDRWVWLNKARGYDGVPGMQNFDISHFESGRVRLTEAERPVVDISIQAKPTWELWGSTNNDEQAELHWRIGMPLLALTLALAAVPLAYSNPRGGRSLNLLFAILLAFSYYNSMGVLQAMIAGGRIPGWLGMWPLHFGGALLVAGLYWWRGRLRT